MNDDIDMGAALFEPAADGAWMPTDRARGPWSPDALHGGPVAALAARAAEADLGDLQPVRLTLELRRPVPVAPLTVSAAVSRQGKKVRLVDVTVTSDGVDVATGSVLAIRTADVPVAAAPGLPPSPGAVPARASGVPGLPTDIGHKGFHNSGVEHVFVAGQFGVPGPAIDWIRLRQPVVAGEAPTPFQRAVAAADFGNGVSERSERTNVTGLSRTEGTSAHWCPVRRTAFELLAESMVHQ